MKTKYNVLTIYKKQNDIVMYSNVYDSYDEVLNHLKRHKEADRHSINRSIEISNDDTSINCYRDFVIFTFKGIKDHFIFDMSGKIPIFIGKCFNYEYIYNFIDYYKEFGVKCFDLLIPKDKLGGCNAE